MMHVIFFIMFLSHHLSIVGISMWQSLVFSICCANSKFRSVTSVLLNSVNIILWMAGTALSVVVSTKWWFCSRSLTCRCNCKRVLYVWATLRQSWLIHQICYTWRDVENPTDHSRKQHRRFRPNKPT